MRRGRCSSTPTASTTCAWASDRAACAGRAFGPVGPDATRVTLPGGGVAYLRARRRRARAAARDPRRRHEPVPGDEPSSGGSARDRELDARARAPGGIAVRLTGVAYARACRPARRRSPVSSSARWSRWRCRARATQSAGGPDGVALVGAWPPHAARDVPRLGAAGSACGFRRRGPIPASGQDGSRRSPRTMPGSPVPGMSTARRSTDRAVGTGSRSTRSRSIRRRSRPSCRQPTVRWSRR